MYFRNFPLLRYSLDNGRTNFIIQDVFTRIKADQRDIINSVAYDEYDIHDGETPEILADKLYNDSQLHWVILITNDILDPRWDWPLDSNTFYDYVVEKYGISNLNAVHHYVNENGDIVHSSYAGVKTPVSNYDYELARNETKRRIKVVKRQYLPAFVSTFERSLINGQ